MSFTGYKEKVEEGNTVILYYSHDKMQSLVVESEKITQTQYGALKHRDLLNVPYGSKVQCAKGWLYILHPTPELWTLTVPHRTQILYSTDISMILLQLDIKPGSIVVEAGTGSGSLSHAILRSLLPNGHLYTYEFHEQRAAQAKQEFVSHGLQSVVTVSHRDVCSLGFDLDHVADAVFLDLPSPWECITSAKKALKINGGRICSFSPCMEQVQKTCEELRRQTFKDLCSLECLIRNFDLRTMIMPIADLGQQKDESTQKLQESSNGSQNMDLDLNSSKEDCEKLTEYSKINDDAGGDRLLRKITKGGFSFKSGLPSLEMQGHTGFLTFATLYPSS